MSFPFLLNMLKRVPHSAALVSVGILAVLSLMIPAVATPARTARLFHHNLLIAPGVTLPSFQPQFWHTERNRILDSRNREVRIAGVNWSGFETRRQIPGGLTLQDYRAIISAVRAQGYNTIRLPLSNQMVESPEVPDAIAFTAANGTAINGDLKGLDSMQILDRIIAAAGKSGLKIILDNHRSEAGDSAEASGLWFTAQYPEESWIADWTLLAKRYKSNATVIGMDLRNEPHNAASGGACWDCGGAHDWHLAAQRAGNAVLHVNPRLLIFVEGVDSYAGDTYWWGGNLEGVRRSPVQLSVPNRLVYSAHEYGPAEYNQAWFNAGASPANLRAVWRRHWAYVSEAGIAPVWIGEFGTPNTDTDVRSSDAGSEGQWFSELVRFLHEQPALQWTYWTVNGEDRYGLMDTQYDGQPANLLKTQLLATILPGHGDARPAVAAAWQVPAAPQSAIQPASPSTIPSTVQPVPTVAPVVVPYIPPAGFVPTSTYAEAARAEVDRTTHVPATPAPKAPAAAQPPAASAAAPGVNQAVADDVQRAIAAAMQNTPPPKR